MPRALIVVVTLGLAALAGCSSSHEKELERLALLPLKQLNEVKLGKYVIPIPGLSDNGYEPAPRRNRMQLEFSLLAEVDPDEEEFLKAAWQRHEGQIRDHVIRTCRHATYEDLEEQDLITLKIELANAIRPFVGPTRIKGLVMSELQEYEL